MKEEKEEKKEEVKSYGNFIPYIPGQTDRELQNKCKISGLEELILKPAREGLDSLTKEELEKYLEIDIDELKKNTDIGMEIIKVCIATQEIIRKGKDTILKNIENKEEGKNIEDKGKEDGKQEDGKEEIR